MSLVRSLYIMSLVHAELVRGETPISPPVVFECRCREMALRTSCHLVMMTRNPAYAAHLTAWERGEEFLFD
jgi:hypothetical protein